MKYAAVFFDWGDTLTALEGDMPVPLPWISQMIHKLYVNSYRLGIITNTYRYQDGWFVRNVLAGLNLLQFFEVFVSSATCGIHKPDFHIFKRAADFIDVPCNKILMVGDSVRCDGGCKAIGMDYMRVVKFENWAQRLYTALEDDFPRSRKLSILAEYDLKSDGTITIPLVHLSEAIAVGDTLVIGHTEYVVTEMPRSITREEILNLGNRRETLTFKVRPFQSRSDVVAS